MKNKSYWQETATLPSFPALENNLDIDIAIIGGGISGIMTAYYLKDTGKRIAVFEKDTLACQTTGHTTAKITYLHKTIYQFLTTYYGKDIAKMYLDSNRQAMKDIELIINKENIECQYVKNDAFVYTKKQDNIKTIDKEIAALQALGVEPLTNQNEIEDVLRVVGVKQQATFHPLLYLAGVIKACQQSGVHFYEHSEAVAFENHNMIQCFTCNTHVVESIHVVLATRYPQINFPKCYFLKETQSREHVSYVECEDTIQHSYLCIDEPIESMRNVATGMLFGGYSHDVGKVTLKKAKINHKVEETLHHQPSLLWSAQDAKTTRGIPYIGYFSNEDDYRYIISGFNKWGMTLSHVAARIIHDLICHEENPYIALYSPKYSNWLASRKDTGKIIKNSFKGMIKNRFVSKVDDYQAIDGKVVRIHNKLVGIAMDDHRHLHFINPVCSHLKCVVSFNALERTWDCPCHGSRFDIDGNIIEGPATASLAKVDIKKDSE